MSDELSQDPIIEDITDEVNAGKIINNGDNKTDSEKKNELNGSDLISHLDLDKDDEDFEDETLMERLIGLSEMFPSSVRNIVWKFSHGSFVFAKGFYEFSRSALWILSTSAIILTVPTMIENERSQMEEMNRQQQRQILLGPSVTGTSSLTPTLMPPQPIK